MSKVFVNETSANLKIIIKTIEFICYAFYTKSVWILFDFTTHTTYVLYLTQALYPNVHYTRKIKMTYSYRVLYNSTY